MPDRYTFLRDKLPPSYVEFIESRDGWEGDLGDEIGYAAIWGRKSIQEYWDDCEMVQYLSDRWFPFGSNGGGEMLCFDLTSRSDRVYWMPFIGMSDENAMLQPFTFADMAAAICEAS